MNNPTPYFRSELDVITSVDNSSCRYWCGCCEPNFWEPLHGLTKTTCTWCTDHCGLTCTRTNNNMIPRLWTSTLNDSRFFGRSGEWEQ